jgi:tRNA-specific 2-thiouridylase
MRHLAAPVGAGAMANPDAVGESGSAACGDVVRIQLRIRHGRVAEAGFLAFGCGAATAAASAACEALDGAGLLDALTLSANDLDRALGGLGDDRRHGPELVADAVARALEQWYSRRLGATGLPLAGHRVAVAMSGGVDSAVAALRLRDAGLDVVGVTMRLWHDPAAAAAERSCCSPETVQLARRTAHALGIPHVTIDAADAFRRGVVEEFIRGYRAGVTPNPCVTCNSHVRFRILADAAALLGARRLATGHYARVEAGAIARAADRDKDQSYMLAMLERDVVDRLEFPLGDLTKAEVREIAREMALPAADAVESQEVCFVGVGGYVPFLERNAGMTAAPGAVVDESGRQVGSHDGYWRYTVGQRRGLGVAAGGPLYVLRTDAATNTVTVGPRERLATRALELRPHTLKESVEGVPLEVRVRYRGRALRGQVRATAHGLRVTLDDPADGVAPGQTAALYRDGRLIGAGIIVEGDD